MESIRWKDHPADLICLLSTLYQNGELIDCVLDTEGGSLKAHRVIIGACSPYFKNLFMDHQGLRTISIKQVKYKDMKCILDFIYNGEAAVPVTDVASLMTAAQFLHIDSLRSCLVPYVSGKLVHHATCEQSVSSGGTPSDDWMKNSKRDLTVQGSTSLSYGKLYLKKKDRMGACFKNIKLQTACDAEKQESHALNLLSDAGNDLETPIGSVNTSEAEKTLMDMDQENLGDEISLISSAAISLVSVKLEGPDDDDDDFQAGSGMKTKSEGELNGQSTGNKSETTDRGRKCDSGVVPFGDLPGPQEDDVSVAKKSEILDDTVSDDDSEDSVVEQTEDLEREFESEFGVEAAKPYESLGNSKNVEECDNASSVLKHRSMELANIDSLREVSERLCGINTSSAELKESIVLLERTSLRGMNPPRRMAVASKGKSDAHKTCVVLYKRLKQKEEEGEPKRKCEHLPLSNADGDGSFCRLCPSTSDVQDGDKRHLSTHATRPSLKRTPRTPAAKTYDCDVCGKSFKLKSRLSTHSLMHAGESQFVCDTCGKTFRSKSRLNTHMRIHTGVKPHDCGICGKSFYVRSKVKKHMVIHTGEKPFVCEVCGKSYNQNSTLKVHMRIHTGEKPFRCSVCDATFRQKYVLEKHYKNIHTEKTVREKTFLCSICGKSYYTGGALKTHMITHTDKYPYVCNVCGKKFVTKMELTVHMYTHTGERPYSCSLCKASFRQKSALNTHMKIHTGEKNFRCDLCGKAFIHGEDLKRHVRVHTGEKPYPCSICSKAFKAKNKLKGHMRVHTGEKPFLCTICGKALKAKWNLRLHMKTHSGEKATSGKVGENVMAQAV